MSDDKLIAAIQKAKRAKPVQADGAEARANLRRNIEKSFSQRELEDIAFDLGIENSNIQADTYGQYIRGLIEHCEHTFRMPAFIRAIQRARPNTNFFEQR